MLRLPPTLAQTAVFTALLALSTAPTLSQSNPPRTPVLVELFTSEGCSSCPPADALLARLLKDQPVPAAEILVLEEHVDYWDSLGWKDPLSNQGSTDRQKAYARAFDSRVYTPQMVVDGTSEMIGSDRAAVLAALGTARPEAIAAVSFAADRRSVAIGAGDGKGEALLVRFLRHRTTDVAAGENAGRILRDATGVRELTTLGAWDGSALSFPIEPPGADEGLAVLVQAPDGRMLGAAALTTGE